MDKILHHVIFINIDFGCFKGGLLILESSSVPPQVVQDFVQRPSQERLVVRQRPSQDRLVVRLVCRWVARRVGRSVGGSVARSVGG